MDLRLSEDQLMFKRMFADFCTKEIRPHGEQIDQAEETPVELLNKAVDQGFWAALVPETMDGCGLDVYTYALMLEELARADMSTAVYPGDAQQPGRQAAAGPRHGRSAR